MIDYAAIKFTSADLFLYRKSKEIDYLCLQKTVICVFIGQYVHRAFTV